MIWLLPAINHAYLKMRSKSPAPTIQPFNTVVPYVTKDGATMREFMHPAVHRNAAQSLAEARISKGKRTLLHRHWTSEELYHVIGERGEITLGDECFAIKTGDTVCIPPGTPHRVQALGPTSLRILCCCSPAYSHEDTELLETVGEEETKGEVREALVTEPAIQRDSATRNYWELRERIGLNQSKFWAAVRVTQSGASRYELGRSIPPSTKLLLQLVLCTDEQAASLMQELRRRD